MSTLCMKIILIKWNVSYYSFNVELVIWNWDLAIIEELIKTDFNISAPRSKLVLVKFGLWV